MGRCALIAQGVRQIAITRARPSSLRGGSVMGTDEPLIRCFRATFPELAVEQLPDASAATVEGLGLTPHSDPGRRARGDVWVADLAVRTTLRSGRTRQCAIYLLAAQVLLARVADRGGLARPRWRRYSAANGASRRCSAEHRDRGSRRGASDAAQTRAQPARVRGRRDRVRRAVEGVVGEADRADRRPVPLRPARGARPRHGDAERAPRNGTRSSWTRRCTWS